MSVGDETVIWHLANPLLLGITAWEPVNLPELTVNEGTAL
jgi:hypothetical protein